MPPVADRVAETSTATGNGSTFALLGAKTGYQSFSSGIGDGVVTYYAIVHRTSGQWESGIGSVTAGVLTRTTVLSGTSGAGTRVNFSAGTSDVFDSLPASKAIYLDPTTGCVGIRQSSEPNNALAVRAASADATTNALLLRNSAGTFIGSVDGAGLLTVISATAQKIIAATTPAGGTFPTTALLRVSSNGGTAYVAIGNNDIANNHAVIGGASSTIVLGAMSDANVVTEYARFTPNGILLGTTVGTSVATSEVSIGNGKYVRSAIGDNSDTTRLFGLTSGNVLDIGPNVAVSVASAGASTTLGGILMLTTKQALSLTGNHIRVGNQNGNNVYANIGSDTTVNLLAAGAAQNGCIAINSDTSKFVYYIGGVRYLVTGTPG